MEYIDTPAGIFRILINGAPGDFEAQPHCPYTYHDSNGIPISPAACYQISLNIRNLAAGDTLEAGFAYGILTNDGGGEGMDNALCVVSNHVVGLGVPDTAYPERQLPYESCGLNGSGFTFRILDDPQNYPPQHLMINFILAWESTDKPYAQEVVSLMTS